jgi:carbon starvation protein CstA
MASVVEEGMALLAQQQAEQTAARTADELAQLGINAVAGLLSTIVSRLADLEAQVAALSTISTGTRVRRPVRDEMGTIMYVVDELQPPIWASPMPGPVNPGVTP